MRERGKTKSVGMAGEAGSLIVQSAAGREESRSTPPLLSVSFSFQRALQDAGATTQGFHTPRSVSSAWERNFHCLYFFSWLYTNFIPAWRHGLMSALGVFSSEWHCCTSRQPWPCPIALGGGSSRYFRRPLRRQLLMKKAPDPGRTFFACSALMSYQDKLIVG